MTRSISFSRPMTGSSFPARAASVRLMPSWSTVGVLLARFASGVGPALRRQGVATALLTNIHQVVKEGNLFVHPIVRGLVDAELLKNAAGETAKAEPAAECPAAL